MSLGGTFDLNLQESKLESLKKKSQDPSFWNNQHNASTILKNISRIENEIKIWSDLDKRNSDIAVLIEFAENGRFVKIGMDEMDLRRHLNERMFISSGD